ncbi:MAG: LytR/AlgR family response regulator transcription factor, partial [Gemmatimonadota bacterium]
MPYVVFVTAYDEYAMRAFDVNAIDYLLKPFDGERLATALARARERRAIEAAAARGERLTALAERMLDRGANAGASHAGRRRRTPPRPGSRRLVVRSRGRIRLVDPDEIDWIESDRNYVRLHTGDRTHLLRHTLGGLAERLDPERFVRIHRSTLVNLDRVVEMRHRASG